MKYAVFAMKRFWTGLACALCVASARGGSGETNTFGFTGPEIYPMESPVALVHAADMDGDGLNDIIVVNNARSKIDILYNRTGKTNTPSADEGIKKDINQLPPDARFKITSIASEKRITSLVVADLNGDGRPDLAYYGDPKELVVQYNLGTNGWSAPKRFPIADGQLSPNALTTGDLHGSGRPGLVLLGENNIYYIAQNADHLLAEPEKIPFSGSVNSLQVFNINGDGRDDLLLINFESPNPFRFRLQDAQGQLGPEVHFAFPAVRAWLADDLLGDHKMELITIAEKSGRAQISALNRKPAEPLSGAFKSGQFQVLPLTKTAQTRRGVLWADVNGDGLPDLLVAQPDSGQLTLYLQQPDGNLSSPKTFPTLSGITDLAVSDWNQDGAPEIFLLSSEEHQIGVTTLDKNGRIAFPALLPFEGRPLAMAVGPLQPGAPPTLAVILDQDGKRVLATRTADGKTRSQTLSATFKSNPSSLTMFDANQDGLADLVILIPYEKIKVLIQTPDHTFDEEDVLPPGGASEEQQPWLSAADVEGNGKPELLMAQKNFLRAVVLQKENQNATNGKPQWTFHVTDQINGATGTSRIVGAAPLRNGSNAVPSLFLLDAERKALTLCERDAAGVWQVVRNLPLPVTDFSRLQPIALGGTNANSLAFIGLNAVGTMALRGDVWELTELDGYETPIPDGHLTDVIAGDLNNHGRKDLVFLETARNYLDLVSFSPTHKLVSGNRWQVFEERTFRSRRNDDIEPREALVADVTGHHKNDLILLVHDRILVYPQE
jgi:hypothetical protein